MQSMPALRRVCATALAFAIGTALLSALGIASSAAFAADGVRVCVDKARKTYREYDGRCSDTAILTMSPGALDTKPRARQLPAPQRVPFASAEPDIPQVPSEDKPKAAASKACGPGFSTHLVIGDSFNDINFLDTSNCNPAPAKGAQFSWSRDAVAANNQWSAKGAVAEKFIWLYVPEQQPDGPYLNLFSFAPVVNFQRVFNSNAKLAATQNVDSLSYGFSSEALIANIHDFVGAPWQVYVRARALANGDFEGNIKSWSSTLEVQPFSDAYRIGSNIPVGTIGYFFFYPLVRAQYFEKVQNSTDPIFNRGSDVFRAGPAISLNFIPQPTTDYDPNKPRPAPQWIVNLTYSWYHDFLHGQEFQHWNPSFTYNITDNVGFSVGYERGKIEANGKDVNLATVSLTVKN